ncbi:hypothetical protein TRV_07925 [Trichophyton verrucosum HKI 0517]|uniref:Adenylate kinase isoenzyme 6 homolog n=1 Tax=Trichophyton verrucosum (strain HKI 0517) TaxID=663202 RepID=D4DL51_TRIVH|nr:uncharacterized protein TRV_07925 [Trichophyton verrucosum HKI 0517]EFE37444.1 hypothetical protein TRV_07925 [Trichophyton verrucosum HKI 0517]
MRTSPNIIITGTPGVGKTVHCEQLAQETELKHLSINQVAKERGCYDGFDEKLKSHIVDEDKVFNINWQQGKLEIVQHLELVALLSPSQFLRKTLTNMSTLALYRSYSEEKLQENLDAEIFGVLLEEAREAYDEEIVVELESETDDAIESNCQRIKSWIDSWKQSHATGSD